MFKVGDRVKSNTDSYGLTQGKAYTVVDPKYYLGPKNYINLDYYTFVETDDGHVNGWWHDRFELVKEETTFKVGDKVKYVKHLDVYAKEYPEIGEVVTVTNVPRAGAEAGIHVSNHGWCYSSESFEPVDYETTFWQEFNSLCLEFVEKQKALIEQYGKDSFKEGYESK
jgi:hypothetical protein